MAATPNDLWETTDLTTAACLRTAGHEYELEVREEACIWIFSRTDEVKTIIGSLAMRSWECDPDELIANYMDMRKEMFRSLDSAREARQAATNEVGPYGRLA